MALLITGCVGSSPALPPDTTSINRARDVTLADFANDDAMMSCDDISLEREKITAMMKQANNRIEGNRGRDQVALYFGGVLAAPFIADTNDPERAQIASLYQRQDTLIKLTTVKKCRAS